MVAKVAKVAVAVEVATAAKVGLAGRAVIRRQFLTGYRTLREPMDLAVQSGLVFRINKYHQAPAPFQATAAAAAQRLTVATAVMVGLAGLAAAAVQSQSMLAVSSLHMTSLQVMSKPKLMVVMPAMAAEVDTPVIRAIPDKEDCTVSMRDLAMATTAILPMAHLLAPPLATVTLVFLASQN